MDDHDHDDTIPWDERSCAPEFNEPVLDKKVTFFTDNNQVYEYENEFTVGDDGEDGIGLLLPSWYDDEEDELEDFSAIQNAESSNSAQESVNSICYNHSRRVLLNYRSYRVMHNGDELLRNISRRSSQECRKDARKQAISLSKALKAVERPPPCEDTFQGFGFDSRMAYFYIESMINTLVNPSWLCGVFRMTE